MDNEDKKPFKEHVRNGKKRGFYSTFDFAVEKIAHALPEQAKQSLMGALRFLAAHVEIFAIQGVADAMDKCPVPSILHCDVHKLNLNDNRKEIGDMDLEEIECPRCALMCGFAAAEAFYLGNTLLAKSSLHALFHSETEEDFDKIVEVFESEGTTVEHADQLEDLIHHEHGTFIDVIKDYARQSSDNGGGEAPDSGDDNESPSAGGIGLEWGR